MFILCHQSKELISYHAINRADIQDTDMEAIMDTIVDSLFCFFVTLGAVPIIRCPRGIWSYFLSSFKSLVFRFVRITW
ncbi:sec1 family domain-containing protein 1-like [Scophthalmus maximus]|uniref:sec1 family domain-containing protein 1-like n=1 Tax=Scophthalmus maximus TaxID=52904 RepID=UPI0015E0C5D5|nr:sec1 family domain-containing protein 1-like [Scophthalmus maximus]